MPSFTNGIYSLLQKIFQVIDRSEGLINGIELIPVVEGDQGRYTLVLPARTDSAFHGMRGDGDDG